MLWIDPAHVARWRAQADQQGSQMALGMRRAAVCWAFASAAVGLWGLGVWWVGSRTVYADGPVVATSVRGVEPWQVATEPAEPAAPRFERVAGRDPETSFAVPRHPASYALDGRSRQVTGHCPEPRLQELAGSAIAFSPKARVAPEFAERVLEFAGIVEQLSRAFYGRAPSAILVASSYDCRSVSGKNERLSEHALGNAIDIAGFRFDAGGGSAADAPFEVRVAQHWKATGDPESIRNARFLDALTQALLARDVFRTLLGPAHPDHADHFHFDMAPSHYVDL